MGVTSRPSFKKCNDFREGEQNQLLSLQILSSQQEFTTKLCGLLIQKILNTMGQYLQ